VLAARLSQRGEADADFALFLALRCGMISPYGFTEALQSQTRMVFEATPFLVLSVVCTVSRILYQTMIKLVDDNLARQYSKQDENWPDMRKVCQ
jgi:hypothetical protein